jgi:uroporphyrinogen-III synthase
VQGKRIVVTRAPDQAAALSDLLRSRGAEPLLYPCIAIAPPLDTAPLDTALHAAAAEAFDWLVVTSTNTVLAVAQRLAALGLRLAPDRRLAVAAVGPATEAAVQRQLGLSVQAMPDTYVAAALVQALQPVVQKRILLPQADLAAPRLAQALTAAGADVTAVTAYRTVPGHGGVDLPALLATAQVDAITFTSPSTVHNCLRRLADEGGDPAHLTRICVACLGPVTAQAAQACGLAVAVLPACHTLEGLIAGLAAYFGTDDSAAERV